MELRVNRFEREITAALDRARELNLYAIVRAQDVAKDEVVIEGKGGITQIKKRTTDSGIGITVFTEDGLCAHGSTDDITPEAVSSLVSLLAQDARSSAVLDPQRNKEIRKAPRLVRNDPAQVQHAFHSKSLGDIEARLSDLHEDTTRLARDVVTTTVYREVDDHWLIARSDGTDVRFSVPSSVTGQNLVLSGENGTHKTHYRVAGTDFSILADFALARVKRAKSLDLLRGLARVAIPLPGGNYKCLLAANLQGLFAHEALGHPAESDLVRKGILGVDGILRVGYQIGHPNISFVDGPIPGNWGDVRYSANGLERSTVTFIDGGKVAASISDIFSADDVGARVTGAARAETFRHLALPRMSGTRMLDSDPYPSDLDPNTASPRQVYELLREMGEMTEPVLVPFNGRGGQVSIKKGSFMFGFAGAWLINPDGNITLHGPTTFSGSTLKTVGAVRRGIGASNHYHPGVCSKGQKAFVSHGSHSYTLIDRTEGVVFSGE